MVRCWYILLAYDDHFENRLAKVIWMHVLVTFGAIDFIPNIGKAIHYSITTSHERVCLMVCACVFVHIETIKNRYRIYAPQCVDKKCGRSCEIMVCKIFSVFSFSLIQFDWSSLENEKKKRKKIITKHEKQTLTRHRIRKSYQIDIPYEARTHFMYGFDMANETFIFGMSTSFLLFGSCFISMRKLCDFSHVSFFLLWSAFVCAYHFPNIEYMPRRWGD